MVTSPSGTNPHCQTLTRPEAAWLALTATLTVRSLLGVALARMGLYRNDALFLAALGAAALGWCLWRAVRGIIGSTIRGEALTMVLLLLGGLLLFAWPAEHFALFGDSAIYPNTAALLRRNGGLSVRYAPWDGLSKEQKALFYVPADTQLSNVQLQSYEGLLYGAYYVTNVETNAVTASRPSLVSVWMGWLDGTAMLYVTPVFGALSLVVVFLLGRRLLDFRAGILAALWLALSFPQLHFSRAPYAEVVGQFFILSALYALITYLHTRALPLCVLGAATLAAAFATRVDSLLALPALAVFLFLLWGQRDGRGLWTTVAALLPCLAFTLWTVNRPYAGATAEILLSGYLRGLRQINPLQAALLVAGALGLLLAVLPLWRRSPPWLPRLLGRGIALLVLLAVGYSLHIRPLSPEFFVSNGAAMRIYGEEVMAAPARYVSPLLFWLAALGIAFLLWSGTARPEHWLFLLFFLSFAGLFFWRYTTGWIYPVALRRMVPEVFPGMMLLAAYAVFWLGQKLRRRWVAPALAGLVMVLLLRVSAPYWFLQEGRGTWQFFTSLAEQLPVDAVVLFEPLRGDSVVGWFAAPLWSFHDRNALLLNQGQLDGEILRQAICYWQGQGKTVLVLAQENPAAWWPGEFRGDQRQRFLWDSTIIGQSRQFPPFVWRFAFSFYLYELQTACPS